MSEPGLTDSATSRDWPADLQRLIAAERETLAPPPEVMARVGERLSATLRVEGLATGAVGATAATTSTSVTWLATLSAISLVAGGVVVGIVADHRGPSPVRAGAERAVQPARQSPVDERPMLMSPSTPAVLGPAGSGTDGQDAPAATIAAPPTGPAAPSSTGSPVRVPTDSDASVAQPVPAVSSSSGPAGLQGVRDAAPQKTRRSPAVSRRDARQDLRAERVILDRAQTALRDGRYGDARRSVGAHARQFPRGVLAEERDGLRIRVALAAGQTARAERWYTRFLQRYPDSLFLPALTALVNDARP